MNATMPQLSPRWLSAVAVSLAFSFGNVAAQTWQLDPAMAPEIVINDYSGALTNLIVRPFPNGQILLSGGFNHVDGVAVRALARLNRDLTFDRSFNAEFAPTENFLSAAPLANGRVLMVVQTSSSIYAIVRSQADGRRDHTFVPMVFNTVVQLTPLPGGEVLVRGDLSTLTRSQHPGLARFDATGALDLTFRAGLSISSSSSVLPGPNGTLVITENSLPMFSARPLVRLRRDGSLDPTFTPILYEGHSLHSVQPDGSVIALRPPRLVRIRNDGTVDLTYGQDSRLTPVRRLTGLADGRVVVQVVKSGQNAPGSNGPIYVLTLDGTIERELRSDAERGELQSIIATLPDQRILLAHGLRVATGSGQFPSYAYEESRLVIATSDSRPIEPVPAQLNIRSRATVRGVAPDASGRALIHGDFTHVNGQSRRGLARLLPDGQLDPSYPAPEGSHTGLLMLPDGGMIVRRRTISPPDPDGLHHATTEIVRLRADGTVDPAFSFPSSLSIASTRWLLAAPDGRILVQDGPYLLPGLDGRLITGTLMPDNRFLWLGSDGRIITVLPLTLSSASNLAIYFAQLVPGDRLLFGGYFTHVNGTARPHLVRLQGDGTIDSTYVPDLSYFATIATAIPLADGRAVVSGHVWTKGKLQPQTVRLDPEGKREPDYHHAVSATAGFFVRDGSFIVGQERFRPDGLRDLNYQPLLRSGNSFGQLESAAIGADGSLWIGGRFDEVSPHRRLALARFLPQELRAITLGPRDTTVAHGGATHLQVATGTTQAATYQWTHDGSAVPGATRAILEIAAAQPADAGVYRARVTLDGQTLTSAPATLTVAPNTARLVNLSARSKVEPDAPQIAGFVCDAPAGLRPILLRAVGFGFPGSAAIPMLPVPVLTVQDATRTLGTDRGGINSAEVAALARTVGAFPITTEPLLNATWIRGSGLTLGVGSGAFTATTTSGNGNSGLSLFEFYDASDLSRPPLARNLSIRGRTSPGVNVLTAGFVIAGNGPLRVLVRGIGPGLAAFGVIKPVPDPLLRVYASGVALPLAVNAAWEGDAVVADASRRAGAFPLAANGRDTAVLLTLEPGAYTVQLAGAAETPAEALIELYALDR